MKRIGKIGNILISTMIVFTFLAGPGATLSHAEILNTIIVEIRIFPICYV